MNNILKILLAFSFFTYSNLFALKQDNTLNNIKQELIMSNGYKAILNSPKSLTLGKNYMNIVILKNNVFIKNADVNIIFALSTMPNIEFSTHAVENKDKYDLNASFKKRGEWEYELMFKTDYGAIYSKEGRLTVN